MINRQRCHVSWRHNHARQPDILADMVVTADSDLQLVDTAQRKKSARPQLLETVKRVSGVDFPVVNVGRRAAFTARSSCSPARRRGR
jgi:hypothetical protein